MILFLVLPFALLIGVLVLARVYFREGALGWMSLGAMLTAMFAGAFMLFTIFRSTSSTAAIGILFIPLYMAVAAPVGMMLGFCAHAAVHIREHWQKGFFRRLVSVVSILILLAMGGWTVRQGKRLAEWRQFQAGQVTAEELARGTDRGLADHDYFVLSAIAANNETSSASLMRIAQTPDPGLHERRDDWLNSFDKDRLAVVRKVIRNPNAPVEALVALAKSSNVYVLGDLAQEKRTPEAVLRQIAALKKGYLVDWGLSFNQNTPADMLEKLPYQKDSVIASNLSRNRNTPIGILEELTRHTDSTTAREAKHNLAKRSETAK